MRIAETRRWHAGCKQEPAEVIMPVLAPDGHSGSLPLVLFPLSPWVSTLGFPSLLDSGCLGPALPAPLPGDAQVEGGATSGAGSAGPTAAGDGSCQVRFSGREIAGVECRVVVASGVVGCWVRAEGAPLRARLRAQAEALARRCASLGLRLGSLEVRR